MSSILLVVESKRGSARLAAEWIAEGLQDYDLVDLKTEKIEDISEYKKVVIGSGILAGQAYKGVKNFVKQFRSEILRKQLYLFITHLEEGEGIEADFRSAYDEEILDHTTHRSGVGGRLRLSDLNFLMRSIMKNINKKRDLDLENFDSMNQERCKKFAKIVMK